MVTFILFLNDLLHEQLYDKNKLELEITRKKRQSMKAFVVYFIV